MKLSKPRPRIHSAAWLKRHGFTNGLWRLDERDKARKLSAAKRETVKK
jgi:hypothetical protein